MQSYDLELRIKIGQFNNLHVEVRIFFCEDNFTGDNFTEKEKRIGTTV